MHAMHSSFQLIKFAETHCGMMQYIIKPHDEKDQRGVVLRDLLNKTGIEHLSEEEWVQISPIICKQIAKQRNNVNTAVKKNSYVSGKLFKKKGNALKITMLRN